jgi:flavin reductase (DIM6/NTAB) family NADH-FMN oxidoreductase RutF
VQSRSLAAALGRIPSGLFVLTMRKEQAETGMLVSWVQQCAFEPPQISLAIKQGREVLSWLTENALFRLNILDSTQTDMIVHFGRGFCLNEPAFEGLDVERPDEGAAVLSEALAYLDARVGSRCPTGDHELIVARVTGGRLLGEGQPMVHVRKSGFHY